MLSTVFTNSRSIFFLFFLVFQNINYGEQRTSLVCHSQSSTPDSFGYVVREEDSRFFILKTQGTEILQKVFIGPDDFSQIVNGYGGTYLYVLNKGRSGYLLIYSHKETDSSGSEKTTSLIDINLFQPGDRGLNTHGPITNFDCVHP